MSRQLSVLLSHRYASGWRHLDQSHILGSCEIEATKDPRITDRHGDSMRRFVVLNVDAEAMRYRRGNIIRAIEDSFAGGCRCEHDCCGHFQYHVSRVRHLRGNRFAAIISGYRNV